MNITVLFQLLIGVLSFGISANVALHATALDRAVPSFVGPLFSRSIDTKDGGTSFHALSTDMHPHHELKLVGDMLKTVNKDEPRATSRSMKKVYTPKHSSALLAMRNPFLYPLA